MAKKNDKIFYKIKMPCVVCYKPLSFPIRHYAIVKDIMYCSQECFSMHYHCLFDANIEDQINLYNTYDTKHIKEYTLFPPDKPSSLIKKRDHLTFESLCEGCEYNEPGQLAHMGAGGCLEIQDS